MTLGANVGTTITAMLAALVTGELSSVTVALAHVLFNVTGIILIWPMRAVPLYLANTLAEISIRSRLTPAIYIALLFFMVPLALIYLMGLISNV